LRDAPNCFEPRAFSASGPDKELIEVAIATIEQMLESIEAEAGEQGPPPNVVSLEKCSDWCQFHHEYRVSDDDRSKCPASATEGDFQESLSRQLTSAFLQ
jgi:hypothetical protein